MYIFNAHYIFICNAMLIKLLFAWRRDSPDRLVTSTTSCSILLVGWYGITVSSCSARSHLLFHSCTVQCTWSIGHAWKLCQHHSAPFYLFVSAHVFCINRSHSDATSSSVFCYWNSDRELIFNFLIWKWYVYWTWQCTFTVLLSNL